MVDVTSHWVHEQNVPLLTDLYELTMMQAYFDQGMRASAGFDLCVRKLPDNRNYLVACGLEDVLGYLETIRFCPEHLDYLRSLQRGGDCGVE